MKKLLEKLGIHNWDDFKRLFWQFFKFGLVGLSNTAIAYSIDMLGFYVLLAETPWPERVKIAAISLVAFIVSVSNSYFWNNRYVFQDGTHRTFRAHLNALLRMAASYAFTGLLLGPLLKVWIYEAGVPYWLSGPLTLIVTVPLNFLLNKFWAFKKGNEKE